MTVNNEPRSTDTNIQWRPMVDLALRQTITPEAKANLIFQNWWVTTGNDKDIEQIVAEVIRFYELGAVERGLQPSGGVAEHGHSEPRRVEGHDVLFKQPVGSYPYPNDSVPQQPTEALISTQSIPDQRPARHYMQVLLLPTVLNIVRRIDPSITLREVERAIKDGSLPSKAWVEPVIKCSEADIECWLNRRVAAKRGQR